MIICLRNLVLTGIVLIACYVSAIDMPISTDKRIKTLVYSENEIFKLLIHYGYQTNIVFSKGEVVKTVSLGDSFAWKITPIDNRLFIKPLQDMVNTNMTIITNKRTYQFDLFSKNNEGPLSDDIVYVLRFFYPEEE